MPAGRAWPPAAIGGLGAAGARSARGRRRRLPSRSARPAARRRAGEFVVSFLDIGQGDATLLQHGGASILVDTGPPDGPILRRLREAGVRRLDALVLTHAQPDHEGGGPTSSAPTGRGSCSTAAPAGRRRPARAPPPRRRARAGSRPRQEGAHARRHPPPRPVAAPAAGPAGAPTATPTTAPSSPRVSVGSFDLLLTADAESDITGPLELPPVDVLKVAHHGSDDPGLPALLARMRPRFARIEVGRGNTYGHPTRATLAHLRAVPHVVRTDRDGTVRLHITAAGVHVERAP